jgi:hypothetical protein
MATSLIFETVCICVRKALRVAAEADDHDTAQAVINAINVTLPLGNLTMVYDELGNKYEIPSYCLSEPTNLIKVGSQNHIHQIPSFPCTRVPHFNFPLRAS